MNFSDVSYASNIAQSTVKYVGWGDAFFDFDNDGWLDFLQVNIGDLFNDGKLEVVTENLKGLPTILRPEGGPTNRRKAKCSAAAATSRRMTCEFTLAWEPTRRSAKWRSSGLPERKKFSSISAPTISIK
jgi:hypothetical protein